MINKEVVRLMNCFPRSFINQHEEVILHERANEYFSIKECKNEIELKYKALEWLSRACYKTEPYKAKYQNDEFHRFMLEGLNEFLGTQFNQKDMELIYGPIGNNCNRNLTIEFVESGYDLDILNKREEKK